MVLRESTLTEAAAQVPVPILQRLSESVLRRRVRQSSYDELVDSLRSGAPWYSPFALPPVREAVDLLEYIVHHEDVRRVDPGVEPRAIPVARQRAVWQRLRVFSVSTMRAAPVGAKFVWPGNGAFTAHHSRGETVTVTGEPVELALVAFGRQRVAHVEYEGSPDAVAALTGARIGI